LRVLVIFLALGASLASAVTLAGYALLQLTLDDAPQETRVRHDDFAFVIEGVKFGSRLAAGRDVFVRLRVENDAKVVDYRWEPSTAYVVDSSGRRYAPDVRTTTPARVIGPGRRALVTLVFRVAPDACGLQLAYWDGIMMGDVFDGLKYARLRLRLDS
jgi:hypothetical protein